MPRCNVPGVMGDEPCGMITPCPVHYDGVAATNSAVILNDRWSNVIGTMPPLTHGSMRAAIRRLEEQVEQRELMRTLRESGVMSAPEMQEFQRWLDERRAQVEREMAQGIGGGGLRPRSSTPAAPPEEPKPYRRIRL